jgi:hypothetical protein
MSYANSGVPSRRARAPGLWPVTVSGRVAWRGNSGRGLLRCWRGVAVDDVHDGHLV